MTTAASGHNRLSDESERVISCATSVEEIIAELAKRGCPDLTALINSDARSQFAVAGGGFCDVYSGALRDGTKIAIKSLRVYEDAYGDGNRKKILKHAARELYHWSKLRHPNVLPLMGLANFQDRISMISKWVNNGNLTSFLQRHPDANRPSLCMDVCTGLRYIHNDGMVHGDLKGANVMVSSDGVAMITDFGNANLKDITLRFTNTGKPAYSLRWAAPELMGDDTRPNKESDVYAYGMTALEVLTGKVPYEEVRDMQLSNTFATGWRPPLRPEIGIDDILWQILEGCWSQKPADRPTIDTVTNQLLLFDPTLINPNGEDLSVSRLPSEIIAVFNTYGYMNLTQSLALRDCSRRPCFSDTSRDVFSGMLRDSTRVAINVIRGIHQETISPAVVKKHAIALQAWSKCNHPNVARIMGFAEFQGRAAIISYWVEHRSINAYIVSNPSADRCSLSRSLSEGLAYLHANSIVYGNLTGASVSVAGNDVAVLAEPDGDLADSRPPTDQPAPVNFPSARWTAPEILKSNTAYTYASDVYALGMTILEIITGRIPFAEIADTGIYEAVVVGKQKPPRPEDCIPSQSVYGNIFWAALTRCWSRNSRLRSSAAEVKEIMKLLTREGLEVVEDEDNSE